MARLVLDAAVLRDEMVLKYEWPADRKSVRWSLVSSALLKSLEGVYTLTPKEIWNRRHLRAVGGPDDSDDRVTQAQGRASTHRHRAQGLKKRVEG